MGMTDVLIQIRRLKYCACNCGEIIRQLYIYKRRKPQLTKSRFKNGHQSQFIKHPSYFGKESSNWKGGQIRNTQGYILIYKPNHPYATNDGYVREHRLVWEQTNNAILLPWADVHHINGDKQDNRIENLEAIIKAKHTILHLKQNGYVINQYGKFDTFVINTT